VNKPACAGIFCKLPVFLETWPVYGVLKTQKSFIYSIVDLVYVNQLKQVRVTKTTNFVQLLTVAAVAAALAVTSPTVHALIQRGELTGVRVGRVYRVPVTSVEQFLIAQGLSPSEIYRGTGQTATARPSPAAPTNADQRTPANAGATVR